MAVPRRGERCGLEWNGMMDGMIEVRVARRTREADDILGLELVSADGAPLPPFSAGSHIDVHTPAGKLRPYSLCNPPHEQGRYQIAVLREPESRGGSASMHDDVREGQVLKISEPRNNFPLHGTGGRPLLLAAGIGITPILCMAERLAVLDADFEMHYCARRRSSAAFLNRIGHSVFAGRVQLHFSEDGEQARLDIPKLLHAPDPERHLYVCGPEAFLDAVKTAARTSGWPDAHIHFEHFAVSATAGEESGSFEVQIASSGAVYTIPPGMSVIEALEEQGVEIPYSCEQGICGTCVTRVLEGIPDHRDLFLSDQEKAENGQFMPCCSRARSPRLVLDI